jgi:hypothetical protein
MTSIPCDNQHCHLPSARVINGVLIIESRHHGEVHRCTISLQLLQNLLTIDTHSVIECAATTQNRHKAASP